MIPLWASFAIGFVVGNIAYNIVNGFIIAMVKFSHGR